MRCGTDMDMRDPGRGDALDARPVLGLPEMRAPFLDDLPSAKPGKGQAGHRTCLLTPHLVRLDFRSPSC